MSSALEYGGKLPELKYMEDSNGLRYITFENILSVGFTPEGGIWVEENCDNYFQEKMSKEEALKLFNKIINFIKS